MGLVCPTSPPACSLTRNPRIPCLGGLVPALGRFTMAWIPRPQKGDGMKSQVVLLEQLLLDAGDSVGFDPSRDILTLRSRYRDEGLPFITITLPRLDDLLLAGLRDGVLPTVVGWRARCAYPEFLRDLWAGIFERDGVLRDSPSVNAIRWLRQISRTFKKVFEVCSADRVEASIEKWVGLDASLPSRSDIKSSLDPYAPMVAQILFGSVIGSAISSPLKGRHGPGAVSERFGANSRWDFKSISVSADSLIGSESFRPSWESLSQRPPSFGIVPARLEAVPKTAEKPRLICIEASYNQFMQQALMHNLRDGLERAHSVCSFIDQTTNREMALESSVSGRFATIDLSDASDRVSLPLVEELFGFNPAFLRYLRLSRSPFVQLPGGDLVLLTKFASMGSALTFPVEAMVFTALVVTSICRRSGDFSARTIRYLGRQGHGLSVYGDDIIVAVEHAQTVMDDLETVGLKVNRSKSFLSGKFRESCGMDAYDGWDVTPVYMRRGIPRNRGEVDETISLTSFRNQIWAKYGNCRTVQGIDEYLTRRCGLTFVPEGTDAIGLWLSPSSDDSIRVRWNLALQRLETWALKPKYSYREDRGTDDGTLLKSLLSNQGGLGLLKLLAIERAAKYARAGRGIAMERSLDLDGRPVASKLYYRWVAVG